jgi:hypothetical protein
MKSLIVAGLALSGLVTGGCASIVKGSTQTISVSSNVEGAEIYLDGVKVGTTPFTGIVQKNKSALMIQKPGYKTSNVMLAKEIEPIFWGNIITGGTLGSITDFASGAAYQYAPATYQVDLHPEGQAQSEFERRVAARKFAMLHLDQISADLAAGSGEHLSALLTLVNGDGKCGADAGAIRAALVTSGGDAARFGGQVVELM